MSMPMRQLLNTSNISGCCGRYLFNGTARGPRPLRGTCMLPFFLPPPLCDGYQPILRWRRSREAELIFVVRAGCVAGCGARGVRWGLSLSLSQGTAGGRFYIVKSTSTPVLLSLIKTCAARYPGNHLAVVTVTRMLVACVCRRSFAP